MASSLCNSGVETNCAVHAHEIAEMGIAEFRLEAPLLLLLHPPACLQSDPQDRLKFLIGDRHVRVGEQQLEQAADGLAHRFDIPAAQCAAPVRSTLQRRYPRSFAQLRPALGQVIGHQAEVVCQVVVSGTVREGVKGPRCRAFQLLT